MRIVIGHDTAGQIQPLQHACSVVPCNSSQATAHPYARCSSVSASPPAPLKRIGGVCPAAAIARNLSSDKAVTKDLWILPKGNLNG